MKTKYINMAKKFSLLAIENLQITSLKKIISFFGNFHPKKRLKGPHNLPLDKSHGSWFLRD
jgi:hypothetical protein